MKQGRLIGLILVLLACQTTRAQSEKPAGEVKRPALQIGSALRFNEDWSTLEGVDTSKTDDFWDRLKFIPFTADQSVWLSIGGQARARFEHFDNFQFGASAPKSRAFLRRCGWSLVLRLSVTLVPTKSWRF